MTRFPIVGIGTSAGGLAALQQFFEHMPADAGMAFVIVQHLDPTVESHLAEVLAHWTEMPVVPIEDGMHVRRNHVYTIVPDRYVRISNDVLHLERPTERRGMRSAIDVFFRSLAEDLAENAICLVLSGAGTDGTAGVRAIKIAGGLAIAQDPTTAQYPAMPLSARSVGMADSVLSPAEMPKALLSYVRTGLRGALDEASPDNVDGLLALILERTGHDFSGYKRSTLTRRIYRRMGLAHTDDPGTYMALLRDRPDELPTLVRDLLINVTSFFRDPEAWDALAKEVIAPLIRAKRPDEPLRIWVPACATGEEAYSIGILVLEEMHAQGKPLDVKIFATDAEEEVVSRARAALYPKSIAADVSAERLSLFFDTDEESYRVKRVLREMLTFAPQNILRDPPFSHMDLISCRNVLIYLEPDVQRPVIALMHFALSEGGYLFLSTAENIGNRDELFEVVSKKWHIYRRVGATRYELVAFPAVPALAQRARTWRPARTLGLADHARSALAELYAPPSVLIDQKLHVLLFHGDTGRFLAQPPGEPTDAILELSRNDLRSPLRAVIQQASRERVSVSTDARLKEGGDYRTARITATPMHGALENCLLVTFDEPGAPLAVDLKERVAEGSERELEAELRTAKEELRTTIEQLEVSNEELKASNEETTSMNEELQSTNEELETSKEELQSINEELTTVNSQLQSKLAELEDRTNDLNNLLKSTDIATLFLDTHLRIKSFTPEVTDLLNVIPSDIGRPLEHLSRRFEDPTLSDHVTQVLQKLVPKEDEIQDVKNRWYLRRVLPYRTDDNRIEGVVITFIDITERRTWEEQLIQSKQYAEHIVNSVRHPLVLLDKDLCMRTANEAFGKLLDLSAEQVIGKRLSDVPDGLWSVPAVRTFLQSMQTARDARASIEVEVEYRHLGLRAMELHARQLDSAQLTLLALEDVTEHRAAERRLRFAMSELLHRVRNILANVRAIAVQSRDHAESLQEFWEAFSGRLDSLASIQSLLAISKDSAVTIEEILLEELRTYSTPGDERYTLNGPSITLKADAAQTLTMILHELTTNSAKYGALLTGGGTIAISWGARGGGRLQFSWIEHGVPDVPKPEHRGFGTLLIEDGVPYSLAGTAKLDFHEDGIACTIELPLGPNIRLPQTGEMDAASHVE